MMSTDAKASFQFTEEMKGYVTFGSTNYEDGYKDGQESDTYVMFHLTIKTDDVDEFVASPAHEAGSSAKNHGDATASV